MQTRDGTTLFSATDLAGFLECEHVTTLYGRADFLRRVEQRSKLGGFSYEVLDTKLARSPKAKFLVQLAFYSDL